MKEQKSHKNTGVDASYLDFTSCSLITLANQKLIIQSKFKVLS